MKKLLGGVAMALYLSTAFSLSMLGEVPQQGLTLRVRPIHVGDVEGLLRVHDFVSAVGHEATARILTLLLGIEVPFNRVAIRLVPGDHLIVFQLGVRLQEGQILSEEEVLSLYREGKASFMMVEVL
jgi:hypothetical protein